MRQRFALDADDVRAALDAALAAAAANAWAVSIAVVDDGAQLLGFMRCSDATPMSAGIAQAKARTAAMARRETKFYDEGVTGGRLAYLGVPDIVALEGGVPILVQGVCIGAVGVSGVKSAEDAQVALAAVKAIGNRAA